MAVDLTLGLAGPADVLLWISHVKSAHGESLIIAFTNALLANTWRNQYLICSFLFGANIWMTALAGRPCLYIVSNTLEEVSHKTNTLLRVTKMSWMSLWCSRAHVIACVMNSVLFIVQVCIHQTPIFNRKYCICLAPATTILLNLSICLSLTVRIAKVPEPGWNRDNPGQTACIHLLLTLLFVSRCSDCLSTMSGNLSETFLTLPVVRFLSFQLPNYTCLVESTSPVSTPAADAHINRLYRAKADLIVQI